VLEETVAAPMTVDVPGVSIETSLVCEEFDSGSRDEDEGRVTEDCSVLETWPGLPCSIDADGTEGLLDTRSSTRRDSGRCHS
jgi:hypothetical protein